MLLRSQKTFEELERSDTRQAESILGDGNLAQPASRKNRDEIHPTMSPGIQGTQISCPGGSGDANNLVSSAPVYSFQRSVANEFQASNVPNLQPLPCRSFANNGIRPDEVASMLPKFSGHFQEDVDHFLKILCNTKQALNVDDQVMKLVLIKQLTGKALHWLHSHADFMMKSFNELSGDLRAMFAVPVNNYQLRTELARRTWSGKEPFEEYCQLKRLLARKLDLPEKELVEYLVEGIEDQTLRNQARIQNFGTVNEVIQAFRMIRFNAAPPKKKIPVCFSCNQPGHFAANCRANFNPRRHEQSRRNYGRIRQEQNDRTINVLEDQDSRNYEEQVKCDGLVKFRFLNSLTNLKALFDTGSPISLIRRGLLNSNDIHKNHQQKCFRGISGKRLKILGIFTSKIIIQNILFSVDFYVVPDNVLQLIDAIIGSRYHHATRDSNDN